MTARNIFLNNIARACGAESGVLRNPKNFPEVFASSDQTEIAESSRKKSHEELLELASFFEDAAKPINLNCHRAESMEEAQAIIVSLLEQEIPEFDTEKHIMLHDHPDVAALGLPETLSEKGIQCHITSVGAKDLRKYSEKALAGITAPELAMAAGAAIVQRELPGQPRSTSLLPSIHIALVRLENIVADYDEFYARLGNDIKTPMVFISGPSKTADIEAVLVHGAHGPKALHCILLDEKKAP